MRHTAAASVLAALLALAALGGCGGAPPVPRDHYYRVLVAPPPASETILFPGIVSVAPLDADGLLRERPLLFSASGEPHEMQQHDYYYWTDPPPHMLQGQLVDYLRHSGVAGSVVTSDLRVASDYEITGRIKRLERLLGGGPPRAVAEIELALIETANNRLVVVQTYQAEARSDDDSVESSIRALNEAVGNIFGRFVADAGLRYTAQQRSGTD